MQNKKGYYVRYRPTMCILCSLENSHHSVKGLCFGLEYKNEELLDVVIKNDLI